MIDKIMGGIIFTLFVLVICFIFVFIGWGIFSEVSMDKNCLKEIGGDYCEEKNMIFNNRIWLDFSGWEFSCYEDERSVDEMVFRFTEEEMEGCKK